MDPDNVENDPVGELPLPLVTVKEVESSLVTSPDEDVNTLDTDAIEPDIPVVVNCPPVPVTDSGVFVIESDVSIVPESVVIETEKDVIPPLPSTLSIVMVASISPCCNCIVSFVVYQKRQR